MLYVSQICPSSYVLRARAVRSIGTTKMFRGGGSRTRTHKPLITANSFQDCSPHLLGSIPPYGKGGGSRTHSAHKRNGFTDRPDSPTSALPYMYVVKVTPLQASPHAFTLCHITTTTQLHMQSCSPFSLSIEEQGDLCFPSKSTKDFDVTSTPYLRLWPRQISAYLWCYNGT